MSRTRALLPSVYADGTRVVSTTLRPIRPACLIPEDDPGMAARFAESRSLAWGGHVGYVLPYSRSEGLRDPWRRLLDLLDPDEVDALGISRSPTRSPGVVSMNATQKEPPKPLASRLSDDLGRMVYTREEPEQLFVSTSALMHSVLHAVGEDLKPPAGKQFVVIPRLLRWSSLYLPVMARYGCVNDAELESVLNSVYSHEYTFNLDLSESVRVEEVDVTEDLLGVLCGDVGGLLDNDIREHALTLPELTLRDLQITGRASARLARNLADVPEEDRYRPIVVTGSDDSVEDFALFWNLRSEHFFAKPFPVWIPIELLEDAEAPAAIERALERFRPAVGEAYPRMDDVLIASASMDVMELQERLGRRFPEARIGPDDLIGLFTETCEYRYTTEKLPAHFDRGRASIQPPRPEELKKSLIPQVDYVAYEVGVDGMWLPQSEAMARHLAWMSFHSHDNVTKSFRQ